jgi:hypothetical protein
MRLLPKAFGYIALTTFILCGAKSQAMDIEYSDKKPVFLRLAHGQETLFRFPEAVKTVNGATRLQVGPANENTPDYSVLKVLPRIKKGSGSVVFILQSGKVIMLSYAVESGKNLRASPFVDFVEKKTRQSQARSKKFSQIDFMRAMLLQKRVRGFKESKVAQEIQTGNKDTVMELRKIYQGQRYNGYVYEIENKNRRKTLVVDVRKLRLGKNLSLVCASVRYPFLAPGQKTKLWVLAKADSSPDEITLPYTKIKIKGS